jgi:hypothetical protein
MSYITSDCYNLNQARTRTGPEHYVCYQAQGRPSGRVWQRPGPVQTSNLPIDLYISLALYPCICPSVCLFLIYLYL